MKITQCAILVWVSIFLLACTPTESPKIAAPQRDALEKAKAIGEQLNQQAIQQQQQIDQQSQ